MNAKHVVILGIVAAASVAATALTLRTDAQSILSDRRGTTVFPALLKRANDIATISVRDNDRTFVIERTDKGFFEKDSHYPAKADAFRSIVAGAVQLAYEEAKTSDPARYGDLNLAEPGKDTPKDKAGREVILRDKAGAVLADFYVGSRDTTVGGARGGLYIRFPKAPQTWLVRGDVPVPAPNAAWFEINIANLNKDALERVDISGGGLDAIELVSPKKGADLELKNPIPEGRKADTGHALRTAFMFDPISFEDVRAPKEEVSSDARKIVATGRDGLKITVTNVGKPDDGWVRISAEGSTDASRKRAEELKPKIDGFEFRLPKNYTEILGWTMKNYTTEAKS